MSDTFQERGDKVVAAAADASKQSINTAAQAGKQGMEAVQQAAERNTQVMADRARDATTAWNTQAADMAERSSQGLQKAVDYNRNLAEAYQGIVSEWANYARSEAERTFERVGALAQARNPRDWANAQRELMWGGIEDLMDAQQRLAKLSMQLMTGRAAAEDQPDRLAA